MICQKCHASTPTYHLDDDCIAHLRILLDCVFEDVRKLRAQHAAADADAIAHARTMTNDSQRITKTQRDDAIAATHEVIVSQLDALLRKYARSDAKTPA